MMSKNITKLIFILRKYFFLIFLFWIISFAFCFFYPHYLTFTIIALLNLLFSFWLLANILQDKKLLRKIKFVLSPSELETDKGPNIVAIGGGTGLPAILRGLKQLTSQLSAIVTMFDDGGSSGKLREQLNILPPGDIRNCLFALAKENEIMKELFQYRFQKGDLKGHPVGNILLAAIAKIHSGDMKKGISQIEKILSIQGRVIPVTINSATLCAIKTKDKIVIKGESNLNKTQGEFFDIYIEANEKELKVNPDAIEAIKSAEIITLGPGSLFTSIIPNLLFKEITNAINNSDALVVYICNLMTESGETDNFSVTDHLEALKKFTTLRKLNYVIYHNQPIKKEYLEKYQKENAFPVKVDKENFKKFPQIKFLGDNIIEEGETLRHNSQKIAELILEIYEKKQLSL